MLARDAICHDGPCRGILRQCRNIVNSKQAMTVVDAPLTYFGQGHLSYKEQGLLFLIKKSQYSGNRGITPQHNKVHL